MHSKILINNDTISIWIIFLVLLVFAGFRWDVGIDWNNYMSLFGGNLTEMSIYIERIEIGNVAIKALLSSVGLDDGGYWLWVMAFITLFFFFYFIWKYSINPLLSVILFVSFGFYFELLNGVRQYVAISLFVYSWRFIINKQKNRYFITIFMASLFHITAIVLIPFYFIISHIYNKRFLIISAIIAIPISFFSTQVISYLSSSISHYNVYSSSQFIHSNNPLSILRVIFPLVLFFIAIKLYDKLITNRITLIFFNLSIISIIITLLFPGIMLAIRIGFYFQFAFIMLIPYICKLLNHFDSRLFKLFTVIYGILYVYITLLSRPVSKILPFNLNFRLADTDLLKVTSITFVLILLFMYIINYKSNNKSLHG